MAEQGAPQSWEPLGAGSPSELGTPQSPSEQHQHCCRVWDGDSSTFLQGTYSFHRKEGRCSS